MLVRSATAADIPAMMAIEHQAPTAAHWSLKQYQDVFQNTQPCRMALVIEEDAALQGFLIAQSIEHNWEIENIVVDDPARRRGLGSRMLQEFFDATRSQGAAEILLEVRESNHAARAFYEKAGFKELSRRVKYYRQPNEDAVIYRLLFPKLHRP